MPIAAGREYYVIFHTQAELASKTIGADNKEVTELTVNKKDNLNEPTLYTNLGNCDVSTEFTLFATITIEFERHASLTLGCSKMCDKTTQTSPVHSPT